MKNRFKSLLVLCLAAVVAVSVIGCNGKDSGNDDTSSKKASKPKAQAPSYINMESALPIVKKDTEDITLKIMIKNGPYYQDMKDFENDIYFINKYAERTNVKVEWQTVASESFDDTLTNSLASGKLPDAIMKGGISNSVQRNYGEQGFFLDLMENDMLKTYAPNYWALAQKYPETLSSSTMPGGSIYSLGLVRNSVGSLINSKMYFNKDWLGAVGKNVPTTSQEFYDVLSAFKSKYPNSLGFYTSSTHMEYSTLGMFGLGNRGTLNGFIDMDEKTGKTRYFPMSDQYREWVEYMSKLYKDGLLSKDYIGFSEAKLGAFTENNTVGAFAYTNLSSLTDKTQNKMAYLNGSLTGPKGYSDWYGTTSVGHTGSFIITSACKYPEVALRWADYFYSDEGALFFYYGDVGVTAVKQSDGTYEFSDSVLKNFRSGKNSYDGSAVYVSLYAYGNTPSKTQVPFNSADDNRGISLKSAYGLIGDRNIAWPAFTFTKKEERSIDDIKRDIDTYVKGERDKWIQGLNQLNDTTWSRFIRKIQQMDVDKVIETYDAALQRAYDNGFKEGKYNADMFK